HDVEARSNSQHALNYTVTADLFWSSHRQVRPLNRRERLYGETKFHHVAVLHDVVLALHACLAARTRLGGRAGFNEVVKRSDLGLDETLLEVGVDDAGRL